jgi:signal recognition particle subunit SRP54
MMVGLQGSGKTTTSGKLARLLKKQGMRPLLAACDLQRPAAVDQLERTGEQAGVPVHANREAGPVEAAAEAKQRARREGLDTLIVDTAGRMHVDEALMDEVTAMAGQIHPAEILFVADGMTGQDAVNSAQAFSERLEISGVVLTKMDGDARGGAALSIREVTGAPIRYIGVGEKLEDFEEFHPTRLADRILGMGDVVTLVEKAQEAVDVESAQKLASKLKKQQFDLEDFLEQMQQMKKMGPLDGLLKMIPGAGKALKGVEVDESEMAHTEAIILSMTPEERRKPGLINGSRRKRIAAGSGTTVQQVNRLLNQYQQMRKLFKRMGGKMPKGLEGLQGMQGLPEGMGLPPG